jgi:hypothetical protein
MSDIIAAVQGYVSPSSMGSLNQETLQQVYNLFQANVVLSYPGNPNGNVAGTTYQQLWDTVDQVMYVNTVYGSATTAVWTLVTKTPPGGLIWNTITTSTVSMLTNNGYVVNSSGLCTLPLPSVSAVGDELVIMGLSSGGYSIAQLAGQQIIIAPDATTIGTGGSLSTTNHYCAITLRCMVASSIWGVSCSPQDAFTIV